MTGCGFAIVGTVSIRGDDDSFGGIVDAAVFGIGSLRKYLK